ncbi:DUF3392 domain-containing protein [Thalassotalea profundi]|uniref:DUF3392 domain-containing protein n=1 Tax=Thalassotalea profundi TaxID=2036687 RepID=A0ABQ3J1T5_9GAMM|nr:DUF3392 domain-containing protein [Thalassotalea profundi]GHE98770.1 hypothetical protein GCM10011501_30430 [Thalassotalea profundi]
MTDWLIELGQGFRAYQYQTALAIIATLLVIFGNDINNMVRQLVRKQHFIIRSLLFVLVCAFGYGLVTVYLTGLLNQQLNKIPSLYIVPSVFLIFLALGMYAQKQRHI